MFSYIFTVVCMCITFTWLKVYYYIKAISTVKIICTISTSSRSFPSSPYISSLPSPATRKSSSNPPKITSSPLPAYSSSPPSPPCRYHLHYHRIEHHHQNDPAIHHYQLHHTLHPSDHIQA